MSPHPHTNIAWQNLFQVISQPNGEGICSNLDYLKANNQYWGTRQDVAKEMEGNKAVPPEAIKSPVA